jgi:preprotein translocase subunit SecY
MSEFMKRLAVTLGALAIYRLGAHLPLAGIDPAALAALYGTGGSIHVTERVSIFALGVMPIISMLLLVEVARLLSGRFNNWAQATPGNIRLLERCVLIGALLLAAVQGLGLANALEAPGTLIPNPGANFRLGVMATLIAGTALLVWLRR